jgi:hypothetical protein
MREDRIRLFLVRVCVLGAISWFVSLERNPIVRLEAKLGLSPSPLERLFGVKGLFSGMTEGMYRLIHGDILGAMSANILTPFFAVVVSSCFIAGYRPRIETRGDEIVLFVSVVVLSVLVNIAALLGRG